MKTELRATERLSVHRDQSESDVRHRLVAVAVRGSFAVSGRDCRALQTLVKVAAREGLEVRDPAGYLVRAADRLIAARDNDRDRKRLRLRWTVVVTHRTMQVPNEHDYIVHRTGRRGEGVLLVFNRGTEMILWDGGVF